MLKVEYSNPDCLEMFVTVEGCLSLMDRTILFYYLKGFTYREIGKRVRCHHSTVGRRVKKIAERVQQTCEKKPMDR